MQRRPLLLALTGLLAPRSAHAGILCDWFGRCLYESPGFRITVVDAETSQPLAGVHALAEWVSYGRAGQYPPLMVQDGMSGADGAIVFPAWGPVKGPSTGLRLNSDPVISLFKPGYRHAVLNNVVAPGTRETDRVHRFTRDGSTVPIERFVGTTHEWAADLQRAARVQSSTLSKEDLRRFRDAYLWRFRLVSREIERLPHALREAAKRGTLLDYRLDVLEGRLP